MENDTVVSLKLIGFKELDAEKFSAVLDLAEFALQPAWQIVGTATADFYLLPEKPKTHNYKGLPRERCFFYDTGTNANKKLAVPVDATQTPRLHALLRLLNRAATQVSPSHAPVAANGNQPAGHDSPPDVAAITAPPPPHAPESNSQEKPPSFNPHQGFLQQLLSAATPVAFSLPVSPDSCLLYIDPKQQLYYCPYPLEQLATCFPLAADVPAIALSTEELNKKIKKTALAAQPLSHLIWYTAFKSSQGQLLPGLSGRDIIHLTQWPYFGADSRGYVKLATFLKNHQSCLDDAAKETGIAPALAADFYNACQLVGLIEKTSATETPQKAADPEKQSLLSKIKNRLKH